MTADELLRARRTVHRFESRQVPEQVVLAAIESARWAPNHKLTEPWEFVVIGPRTADAIAELNAVTLRETKGEKAAAHKLERWKSMPGWLLLTCRRSEDALRQQEDYAACCCAAQNFMLSLWGAGIGSKWSSGPVTRDGRLYPLVGLKPEERFVVGLFWFGYAGEESQPRRGKLDDVVRRLP